VEKHCGIEIASQLVTNDLMPQTLNSLSQVVTDEVTSSFVSPLIASPDQESEVRLAAEKSLQSIGRICGQDSLLKSSDISLVTLMNYILPRSAGEVAGMDTSHHRTIPPLLSHPPIVLLTSGAQCL
jgi:hypothetical protein